MHTLITPTTLNEFVMHAVVLALQQLDLSAELVQQVDISAALEAAIHQLNTPTDTVPATPTSEDPMPDIQRMVRMVVQQRMVLQARHTATQTL